jgi:probable rRNA maturation factor
MHHFAHLVIHGTLHLQGFDHIEEAQAKVMEDLEAKLLATLDIPNPYVAKESN